jgi:hypothetical protein
LARINEISATGSESSATSGESSVVELRELGDKPDEKRQELSEESPA